MLIRPRRNRKNAAIRDMVQESHLSVNHLIYPLFLVDGKGIQQEIISLPRNYRWSLDLMLHEIESSMKLGLNKFVLFPAVEDQLKDRVASYSYAEENFYLKAIRSIKERFPDLVLMSDVAMDP
ncbi:MAG: delta-aminolevulinic acid dehydratase, partial [Bacteroidota bacterium]